MDVQSWKRRCPDAFIRYLFALALTAYLLHALEHALQRAQRYLYKCPLLSTQRVWERLRGAGSVS